MEAADGELGQINSPHNLPWPVCRVKPKGNICLLVKWAGPVFGFGKAIEDSRKPPAPMHLFVTLHERTASTYNFSSISCFDVNDVISLNTMLPREACSRDTAPSLFLQALSGGGNFRGTKSRIQMAKSKRGFDVNTGHCTFFRATICFYV